MSVKCFYAKATGNVRVFLRRYRSGDHKCRATGYYCNGMAVLHDAPAIYSDKRNGYLCERPEQVPRDDPRWPKVCDSCGEDFDAKDEFQIFQDQIYESALGVFPLRQLPPGSIYDATWYHDVMRYHKVIDGKKVSLVCILPSGEDWPIDGPSSNGNGWQRTGSAEEGTLDVQPSILTKKYHGWLRNGFLVPC